MEDKYIISYTARHIDGNIVTEHRGTVMADRELTKDELMAIIPHKDVNTLTFSTTLHKGVSTNVI